MSPDQRARALRLADLLDDLRYAGAFHDAAFLRELAAEPERVPLTDDEISNLVDLYAYKWENGVDDWATQIVRVVERAHGIV